MDVTFSSGFLRKFIKDNRMTVNGFAKELQTTCAVISNWLTGRCRPSEESANRLVKYFKKKGINLSITPSANYGRKCDYMFNTKEHKIVPREENEDFPWVIPLREACDTHNYDYTATRLMVNLVNKYGKECLIKLIELN